MSGIELILSQVNELEDLVGMRVKSQGQATDDGILQHSFAQIRSNLTDISHTNTFMLLAINRTQEFAKTATGGKLLPAYETVDIRETLRVPIHVIQSAHHCETITLSEIPGDLSSYVITDGHWVQENLLCLLSNATKYSTGGPVQVRLTKEPRHILSTEDLSNLDMITESTSTDACASTRAAKAIHGNLFNTFSRTTSTNAPTAATAATAASNKTGGIVHDSLTSMDSFIGSNSEFMLKIEVIDSGIGISEDNMSRLFNPFQMAQRLAGGTGLGLYSLAKRVEALKGEYGVNKRSDAKNGSIFWFSFPYRPDTILSTSITVNAKCDGITMSIPAPISIDGSLGMVESASRATMTPLHINSKSNNLNGTPRRLSRRSSISSAWTVQNAVEAAETQPKVFNILLVEDAPPIYKITKALLERQGHTVTHAVNGAIAVEMVQMNLQMIHATLHDHNCSKHISKSIDELDGEEEEEGAATAAAAIMIERAESKDFVIGETESFPAVAIKQQQSVHPFDVILMDLHMPVMDGLEATKRIRKLELSGDSIYSSYRQRIVGLSANSDYDTLKEAVDCGFDAFMEKPFNMNTFEAMVLDLLSRASYASSLL